MKPFVFCLALWCPLLSWGQNTSVKILNNDPEIGIVPLDSLNSDFRETNLSITPDGQYLFFMSSRGGQEWSHYGYRTWKGDIEYEGDLWYSQRQGQQWSQPVNLGEQVNTSYFEDEPSVSADGQFVVFQSWDNWRATEGPYYLSRLEGLNWTSPTGLGGGIGEFFRATSFETDGMCIDGQGEVFLTAAGPRYLENMDIFISRRGADGTWGKLDSLALNTAGDERSVFIAGDGQTLYFASTGYGGFGGMDIFKTTLYPDNRIGEILNIGAPFNTPEDDYGFIITAAGTEAYFVRNGDIYVADLGKSNEEIGPSATLLIKGNVRTPSGKAVLGEVRLIEKKSGRVMATSRSNAASGAYTLSLANQEGNFALNFYHESYQDFERSLNIPHRDRYVELTEHIMLPEYLAVAQDGQMRGGNQTNDAPFVFLFDSDSHRLKSKYQDILMGLAMLQAQFPDIKLEISGYTDSDGDSPYNERLARRRAESIRKYLLRHGGISQQMILQIFGENRPVQENDTEAGKAENRRVEIRLVYPGG